jgi:hypothetical protein
VLSVLQKRARALVHGLELFEDVDGRQSVRTAHRKI